MHISNHSMQVGDRGVVVVGASAELGDLGHLGSAGTSTYPKFNFCHGACSAVVSVEMESTVQDDTAFLSSCRTPALYAVGVCLHEPSAARLPMVLRLSL